jgi:hypothetical protein
MPKAPKKSCRKAAQVGICLQWSTSDLTLHHGPLGPAWPHAHRDGTEWRLGIATCPRISCASYVGWITFNNTLAFRGCLDSGDIRFAAALGSFGYPGIRQSRGQEHHDPQCHPALADGRYGPSRAVYTQAIAMTVTGDSKVDPAHFLANSGLGRKLLSLKAKDTFFTQGGPADCVFYLQTGCAKLTVVSKLGNHDHPASPR